MNRNKASVVICGAGPAGLTLAHLLGARGIDVIVLEKLATTVTEPRAIAIDAETMRTLQSVDLVDGLRDELLMDLSADYVNGKGELLFELGGSAEQPYGFPFFNSFDQPALDRFLADSLARYDRVRLRFNHTLEHFEQSDAGVTVLGVDADGAKFKIDADYLVGCDGGRSTIRNQLGIAMHGDSHPLPWLVIDTIDPHLDDDIACRFFCDPARPGMTIKKRRQQRRWEWMLMPGETPEELLDDRRIRELIAPYTDAERVNVYRKRVYNFHSIIAERWREGRVFLAGDAAHMTPPFAGQGLNSGMRDVRNLSWKLAGAINGQLDPQVLESYESERLEHARELIETAVNLGRQIQPVDPNRAAERDAHFAELHQNPEAYSRFTRDMLRALRVRELGGGLVIDPGVDPLAGQLAIQPLVNTVEAPNIRFDEQLGQGFAIIAYNCDPARDIEPESLAYWVQHGTTLIKVNRRGETVSEPGCVEDAYGDFGRWLGERDHCLLLLRPDRFCMAVFTRDTATAQLNTARSLLEGDR